VAQHRDLAERVERAEVHEDDVDDIAAVPQRRAELREVLAEPRRGVGGGDRQDEAADERADSDRDERVTQAHQPG